MIGVGSTRPLIHLSSASRATSATILQFNTRALGARDPLRRARTRDYLLQNITAADVWLLTEVHGSKARLESILHPILWQFHLLASHEEAVGGVAAPVSKQWAPNSSLSWHEVVPGRVVFLLACGDRTSACIWGAHNFGITKRQFSTVRKVYLALLRWASRNPQRRFVHFGADLNFPTVILSKTLQVGRYLRRGIAGKGSLSGLTSSSRQLNLLNPHRPTTTRHGNNLLIY